MPWVTRDMSFFWTGNTLNSLINQRHRRPIMVWNLRLNDFWIKLLFPFSSHSQFNLYGVRSYYKKFSLRRQLRFQCCGRIRIGNGKEKMGSHVFRTKSDLVRRKSLYPIWSYGNNIHREPTMDWANAMKSDILNYKEFLSCVSVLSENRRVIILNHVGSAIQNQPIQTSTYKGSIQKTGEIKNFFQMGFFPMATWRIQFLGLLVSSIPW